MKPSSSFGQQFYEQKVVTVPENENQRAFREATGKSVIRGPAHPVNNVSCPAHDAVRGVECGSGWRGGACPGREAANDKALAEKAAKRGKRTLIGSDLPRPCAVCGKPVEVGSAWECEEEFLSDERAYTHWSCAHPDE